MYLERLTKFEIPHILEHSGEGSVMRKPESFYVNGISDCLLKIKV
jgi:hypothetical protein